MLLLWRPEGWKRLQYETVTVEFDKMGQQLDKDQLLLLLQLFDQFD